MKPNARVRVALTLAGMLAAGCAFQTEAPAIDDDAIASERAALEDASMQNLQTQMQHESQVATSVSNVLKTRHDTAKNSIGNIR